MARNRITLFSFGYSGWGNATQQLVRAVDAIEESRGFRPPVFIDIRIQRAVRAVGFRGAAFEEQVGERRYTWMKSLGNKQILSRTGPRIQINDPKAVNELLDRAMEEAERGRRVIFFCSCPWPCYNGKVTCHRTRVATLVLAAARRRAINVEVVEWPGGKRREFEFPLDPEMFRSVRNGRIAVPLPKRLSPQALEGPPWGSIATYHSGDHSIHRIVGPAMWQKEEWCLQVCSFYHDPETAIGTYRQEALPWVKSHGLCPRKSTVR